MNDGHRLSPLMLRNLVYSNLCGSLGRVLLFFDRLEAESRWLVGKVLIGNTVLEKLCEESARLHLYKGVNTPS